MPDSDQAAVLALAAALGWASGLRLYATLFAAVVWGGWIFPHRSSCWSIPCCSG